MPAARPEPHPRNDTCAVTACRRPMSNSARVRPCSKGCWPHLSWLHGPEGCRSERRTRSTEGARVDPISLFSSDSPHGLRTRAVPPAPSQQAHGGRPSPLRPESGVDAFNEVRQTRFRFRSMREWRVLPTPYEEACQAQRGDQVIVHGSLTHQRTGWYPEPTKNRTHCNGSRAPAAPRTPQPERCFTTSSSTEISWAGTPPAGLSSSSR